MAIWKDVLGYEGRYQVSDDGRVKSLPNSRRKTELILKITPQVKSGHLVVNLTDSDCGKWRQRVHYVHVLVLKAFVSLAPAGTEACHNDGNPANNALTNLRWDTRAGNQADRKRHGTDNSGERNGGAKLAESDVRAIKSRLSAGCGVTALAREFKVSHALIGKIKSKQIWRNV